MVLIETTRTVDKEEPVLALVEKRRSKSAGRKLKKYRVAAISHQDISRDDWRSAEPEALISLVEEATVARLKRYPYHQTQIVLQKEQPMELGAFSISLAVKDLEASKAFYEKFGFTALDPDGNPILVDQHV